MSGLVTFVWNNFLFPYNSVLKSNRFSHIRQIKRQGCRVTIKSYLSLKKFVIEACLLFKGILLRKLSTSFIKRGSVSRLASANFLKVDRAACTSAALGIILFESVLVLTSIALLISRGKHFANFSSSLIAHLRFINRLERILVNDFAGRNVFHTNAR